MRAVSFCLLVFLPAVSFAKPLLRIATVSDGTWREFEQSLELIEQETRALLGDSYNVQFPRSQQRVGDWSIDSASQLLSSTLGRSDIDLVVGFGLATTTAAGRLKRFPKPFISTVTLDPTYQGLPFEKGHSGVSNFNYLLLPLPFDSFLETFHRTIPVEQAAMLIHRRTAEAVPRIHELLTSKAEALGFRLSFVLADEDVDAILKNIPDNTQAVYLAPMPQLTEEGYKQLIRGLNARRLPSFAHMGDQAVRMGALAGFVQTGNRQRTARRVALNIERILEGEDAGKLPVTFTGNSPKLTINKATARAIGFSPSWKILSEAEVIQAKRESVVRQLTLKEVMEEVKERNLTLLALQKNVQAGKHQVGIARSNLLPQVNISANGLWIDEDRAAASFGSNPERSGSASLSLSQQIYSEQAWAGFDIESSVQTTREEELSQSLLDVQLNAAVAYFNVLKTKTAESIQRDNLRITRKNRELAALRNSVGQAGPGEVYRWDNKLARDQRSVIQASAVRNQAEIALNTVLNRPLEEPFQTEAPVGVDDAGPKFPLRVFAEKLFALLSNPQALRFFRSYMAEHAEKASPELRRLNAAVEAQRRALTLSGRRFWLPTFGLQAEISHRFWEDGAGSEDVAAGAPFAVPNDTNWNVGVLATLPLFEGGGRFSERLRALNTLNQTEFERDQVRLQVEQRIRGSIHQTGASHAGIGLTQEAAFAAERSLDLITDAYSRGAVPIIDLLDAQNNAFIARQAAANAVYDFLIDVLSMQRASGGFQVLPDDASMTMLTEFENYLEGHKP